MSQHDLPDLPDRARTARNDRGWSQKDLAERAGVSTRWVQTFENRQSNPHRNKVRAVVEALDLDPDSSVAEETRSEWPKHIQVALDALGAYFMSFPEDDQVDMIHDLMRQIFNSRNR